VAQKTITVASPAGAASGARGRLEDIVLRAVDLRRSFKMGEARVDVLRGVNLAVGRGEFLAIEGRSGSGKSTLLHILAGLDSADSGRVEYEGNDIAALAASNERMRRMSLSLPKLDKLAQLIDLMLVLLNRSDRRLARIRNNDFGFVFQFYHLLPEFNVLENTMLAAMIQQSWLSFRQNRPEIRERAREILRSVGLEHRVKQRVNLLSGGERQRVAIARALMNSPKVLFADEPTGNLDAETGQQIMTVLEKLHETQNQTIIMVTHDRTLAREADRVLVLKDGTLGQAD